MTCIDSDITLSLIKKGNELVGINLVAIPKTQAEVFCKLFPRQLENGESCFVFKYEQERFVFCSNTEGSYSFKIDPDDLKDLQYLLCGRKGPIAMYKEGVLIKGFKIIRRDMRNVHENTEPSTIILN